MNKTIRNLVNRFSWLLITFSYVIVNLVFNYRVYWHQLVTDLSKTGAVWGEVQVYEWLADKFYQTIIAGQNPFGLVQGILYPFGFHLGLTDAGNGLFFLFLRPFFSMHQSMSVISTSSLIFANIAMYLLLRSLKFDKMISFFIGLAYGYMTFLLPRGGHLNYWCIYLFPLFYYSAINLLQSKKIVTRILSSIGISLFFVLTLWLNFYYFVMLLISIFAFLFYGLFFTRKLLFKYIKELWLYGILIATLIFILLIPWLYGLYEASKFDEIPKTSGWGGAIEFSSDLFHYFVPSIYNYYYGLFVQNTTSHIKFANGIFENFTYPGLIVLISYFFFFVFYRKMFPKIKKILLPYLLTSLIFLILTLGPFLHIFGHWGITLEGIRIVVPLPYLILHYIPFLNNIRVPGRLIVGFIFFAYIVCAYIISDFIKNKTIRFKFIFFLLFFIIFIIDQRVANNIFPPAINHPYQIFDYIKSDQKKVSVLEIPFTVRDGFTYFGDNDAVMMTVGGSIHDKNIIGGYTGRIPDYKKNYYFQNPFLGYLGRIIDKEIKINPRIDQSDLNNWVNLNIEKSKDTIEFLDLKYIIVDEDRNYAATLSAKFKELDFVKKMTDKNFSLWERTPDNKEFLSIHLENPNDNIFLGMGWHNPEGNFRWADRKSSVMFKIAKKRKLTLNFKAAAFYKNQKLAIYLNKKKVGQVDLSTGIKDYSLPINTEFEKGINFVYLISNKYYRPNEVISGSLDKRQLSSQFFKIYLTEVK